MIYWYFTSNKLELGLKLIELSLWLDSLYTLNWWWDVGLGSFPIVYVQSNGWKQQSHGSEKNDFDSKVEINAKIFLCHSNSMHKVFIGYLLRQN